VEHWDFPNTEISSLKMLLLYFFAYFCFSLNNLLLTLSSSLNWLVYAHPDTPVRRGLNSLLKSVVAAGASASSGGGAPAVPVTTIADSSVQAVKEKIRAVESNAENEGETTGETWH
jgi:hypothetical protein